MKLNVIRVHNLLDVRDSSREVMDFTTGQSLEDLFPQPVVQRHPWGLSINGKVIDPADRAKCFPSDGDYVVISVMPEGDGAKSVLRLVAMIAVAYFAPTLAAGMYTSMGGTFVAANAGAMLAGLTVGITVVGGMLVNALLPPPKPPAFKSESSSPSYGIDGAKNTSAEGIPVPVCYGQFRTAGNVVGNYVVNDGDTQFLYMLICAGEGPIASITDIEVNEQPIANYADHSVDIRLGTPLQSVIDWFSNTIVPVNVGQEFTEVWKTFTLGTPGIDEYDGIRFDVSFPNGLFNLNNKGKLRQESVSIQIEYRPAGSTGAWTPLNISDTVLSYNTVTEWVDGVPYTGPITQIGNIKYAADFDNSRIVGFDKQVPVYGTSSAMEISGAQREALRRSFTTGPLTQGAYEFRYKRTTTPSTDLDVSDKVYLTDANKLINEKVAYRHTAMLALKFRLGDQLSGIPNVTFLNGGKLVKVFDESTGAWAPNLQSSANPAWIAFDILTNKRYGGGAAYSRVDLAMWRDWANWCASEGLDFHGNFDTASNVWDAATAVARCGRAQIVARGTKYSVVVERAAEPVMMFSVANMIAGTFKESWSNLSDRANEIEVTYHDKTDSYKSHTVRLYDQQALTAGRPQRVATVEIRGIVDAERAFDEAKLMLNMNRHIQRSIEFAAPIEAIACIPGDVVLVQHDMPAWGAGGLTESGSTTTLLKLDREVLMEGGKNYAVMVHYNSVQRWTGAVHSVLGDTIFLSGFDGSPKVKRLVIAGTEMAVHTVIEDEGLYGVTVDDAAGITVGMIGSLHDTNVIVTAPVLNPLAPLTIQEFSEVTLASPLPSAPAKLTKWMHGESVKVSKPFRVVGISGSHEYRRDLSLIEYSDFVYDLDADHPVFNYSALKPRLVSHVTDLAVTETSVFKDSYYETEVTVAWQFTQQTYKDAIVYLSRDGGVYQIAGYGRSKLTVIGIRGEVLEFIVVARDVNNNDAGFVGAPKITYTVLGSDGFSDVVAGLSVVATDIGLRASWLQPADNDWQETEIRNGADWDTASLLFKNKDTTALLPFQPAGTFVISAKHRTPANESEIAATASLEILNPATITFLPAEKNSGSTTIRWENAKTTQRLARHIIKIGEITPPVEPSLPPSLAAPVVWEQAAEVTLGPGEFSTSLLKIKGPGAAEFLTAFNDGDRILVSGEIWNEGTVGSTRAKIGLKLTYTTDPYVSGPTTDDMAQWDSADNSFYLNPSDRKFGFFGDSYYYVNWWSSYGGSKYVIQEIELVLVRGEGYDLTPGGDPAGSCKVSNLKVSFFSGVNAAKSVTLATDQTEALVAKLKGPGVVNTLPLPAKPNGYVWMRARLFAPVEGWQLEDSPPQLMMRGRNGTDPWEDMFGLYPNEAVHLPLSVKDGSYYSDFSLPISNWDGGYDEVEVVLRRSIYASTNQPVYATAFEAWQTDDNYYHLGFFGDIQYDPAGEEGDYVLGYGESLPEVIETYKGEAYPDAGLTALGATTISISAELWTQVESWDWDFYHAKVALVGRAGAGPWTYFGWVSGASMEPTLFTNEMAIPAGFDGTLTDIKLIFVRQEPDINAGPGSNSYNNDYFPAGARNITVTLKNGGGAVLWTETYGEAQSSGGGGGSGVPGVLPSEVASCTAWFDFTRKTDAYEQHFRNDPVDGDGDYIVWKESRVPNATHFVGLLNLTPSADNPVFREGGDYGDGAAEFLGAQGIDAWVYNKDATSIGRFTMPMAYNTSAKAVVVLCRVRSGETYNYNYNCKPVIGDAATNRFQLGFYDPTVGDGHLLARGYTYDGAEKKVDVQINTGEWVVLTLAHGGGNLSIRANGGAWSDVACGATSGDLGGPTIGYSNASFFDGDIKHVVFFNSRPSDTELANVEARLLHLLANEGSPAAGTPDGTTIALLHMDGADGDGQFVDSAFAGTSVYPMGAARHSTAWSAFGGASGFFGGTDGGALSGLMLVRDGDFKAADSNDFTYEGRFRFSSINAFAGIFSRRISAVPCPFELQMGISGNLRTLMWDAGGSLVVYYDVASGLVADTDYTIAVSCKDNVYRVLVNGVTISTPLTLTHTIPASTAPLYIGRGGDGYLRGYIDEVLISNDGLHTGDYTPATEPFDVAAPPPPPPPPTDWESLPIYAIAAGSAESHTLTFNNPGAKRVWMAAEDMAGNMGTPAYIDIDITGASKTGSAKLYQWSVTQPTIAGNGVFTWENSSYTRDVTDEWSLTPASPVSFNITLWQAEVIVSEPTDALTTEFDWSTAVVSAIGFKGSNGNSARIAYAKTTLGTLSGPDVTTSGATSFPPDGSWGANGWGASPPTPVAGEFVFQTNGIYNPDTDETVWGTPYLSTLKVGALSAISANLGNITAGQINFGAFTSFDWPAAGAGGGAHLSSAGFRMGNYNDGRYFWVTPDGDVYAPGFSIVDGDAVFNGTITALGLNIVGTENIQAGAVTSTRFASGSESVAPTDGVQTVLALGSMEFLSSGNNAAVLFLTIDITPNAIEEESVTTYYWPQVLVKRNGVTIKTICNPGEFGGPVSFSVPFEDTPTNGTWTYSVTIENQESVGLMSASATLFAIGLKR